MYYCLPDIATDEKNNLKKPYRILKIPNNFPFKPNINGYSSLKDLRSNDLNWKKYNLQDSKSANKICENRHVLNVKNFVLTNSDNEFDKVSFKILKHTVMGELSNNINGIHLLSNLNRNIKKVIQIKKEDMNGV